MTNAEKKAGLLSSRLYNEALDRAQIHDLTGAAEKLRISLQFNQKNIPARNLYGLVLYERGEAGEALHQWILSQNLLPAGNPASYYIQNVQKDTARIRQMNRGVSDYNEALRNCQEGNEDVGALRLRRAVQKNPKLVDAFVLLALIPAILFTVCPILHPTYRQLDKFARSIHHGASPPVIPPTDAESDCCAKKENDADD